MSIRQDRSAQSYDNILQKIAEEALVLVRGNAPIVRSDQNNPKNPVIWGCFSHITEYDPFSESLIYTASFPAEIMQFLKTPEHRLSVNWSLDETFPHGLTARVAREAKEEVSRHRFENLEKPLGNAFFRYCRDIRQNDESHCEDYRALAPLEKDADENDKILSQISIGLLSAESDLLGVLTLEHVDPDPFGDEDIQLLRLFAGYAAIVIKNAQALGEREYFARTFIHEVNTSIANIESIKNQISSDSNHTQYNAFSREISDLILYINDLEWMSETLPALVDSMWKEHVLPSKRRMSINEVFGIIHEVCEPYEEVSVEVHIPNNEQIFVNIDRYAIMHVLKNLIKNARSKSDDVSDEWSITIDLRVEKSCLKVSVLDQGSGWDPNGNQFKPLYKTDKHGIGLVLSRRLINLHGGELDGKANTPRGADVWFTVPIVSNSMPG